MAASEHEARAASWMAGQSRDTAAAGREEEEEGWQGGPVAQFALMVDICNKERDRFLRAGVRAHPSRSPQDAWAVLLRRHCCPGLAVGLVGCSLSFQLGVGACLLFLGNLGPVVSVALVSANTQPCPGCPSRWLCRHAEAGIDSGTC